MDINGWVSNLTKNTASVRMNFDEGATDEQVYAATLQAVVAELRRVGRHSEATAELWKLKQPINRDYPTAGKSSARIRLVRLEKEKS